MNLAASKETPKNATKSKLSTFQDFLKTIRFPADTDDLFTVKLMVWLFEQSEDLRVNVYAVFPKKERELFLIVENNIHYICSDASHVNMRAILNELNLLCYFSYFGSRDVQKNIDETERTIGLWDCPIPTINTKRYNKVIHLDENIMKKIKDITL